ncbi:copper amine oxidase N-terminal domain-containing protein [Alkalihalobacillus oceani]|uniref:stalk domain-containing protein n=1 Tax=Halalkalibacter oceani TaxID=1653776 RepID=UPI00203B7EC6|nr:stalk domain-containing protein [Halalkalibacter oceani]MCM3760975.1 copper amine oxidase N-terminal domain-containing protein [Halalkalibacter oceani]
MKKKLMVFMMASVLVVGFALGASASPILERISAHLNWSISFVIDGSNWVPTDQNNEKLAPITYQNTTYLPIRAVSEALGVAVDWDQQTQTISLGEGTESVPVTSEEVKVGYSAFTTVDKRYTVQQGKDYQSGIVLESINSAAKNISLLPANKYQTVNLTLAAIDADKDIRVQVIAGETVLKDVTLTAGQPLQEVNLEIGGIQELKVEAVAAPGSSEKLFITGDYQ